MLTRFFFLAQSLSVSFGAASESASDVPYGCSVDPWFSILRRIQLVQSSGVSFSKPEQPSCETGLREESAIKGYVSLIMRSFF